MALTDIRKIIDRISDTVSALSSNGINSMDKKIVNSPYNFKEKKKGHYMDFMESNIKILKMSISGKILEELFPDTGKRTEFKSLVESMNTSIQDVAAISKSVKEMKRLLEHALIPKEIRIIDTKTLSKRIPAEIKGDILADINELEKCFISGCYRSVAIICGRLLEIALHRKYYDATGLDILEKSPGIGLGKLVAKLSEKKIELDPGLSQQIHLINQVRVFSVHIKKNTFSPNKNQAHAMILYTTDILEKIFGIVQTMH